MDAKTLLVELEGMAENAEWLEEACAETPITTAAGFAGLTVAVTRIVSSLAIINHNLAAHVGAKKPAMEPAGAATR